MNSNEYRKRIEPYVILESNLEDINAYVKGALNYLKSDNKENYDLEEIMTSLSCIPNIIKDIRKITKEMKYKIDEMERMLDEQL